MQDNDKYYKLVKDALAYNHGKYFEILEESMSILENIEEQDYEKEMSKMHKKYCSMLSDYVMKKLDDEHRKKLMSIMDNPYQIESFKTLGESYFDIFGFQAGHILMALYYIDNIPIDPDKCLELNHLQKQIINSEMYEIGKKYNALETHRSANNGTGCSFVILLVLLPLLVLSVKIII